jgi:hypothetical protein
MTEQRKLSAAEQRVFLRKRSEELRAEAIAISGDPQARASFLTKDHQVQDQLPGGSKESYGAPTLARVTKAHFDRAPGDPQKPASEADRHAAAKRKEDENVNLVQKAQAKVAAKAAQKGPAQ